MTAVLAQIEGPGFLVAHNAPQLIALSLNMLKTGDNTQRYFKCSDGLTACIAQRCPGMHRQAVAFRCRCFGTPCACCEAVVPSANAPHLNAQIRMPLGTSVEVT